MSKSGEVRTFRSPRWVSVVAALSVLLILGVALLSFRIEGLSWVTITLLCLAPVGVAGFIDALTQRFELHEERIVVVRNLRKREYPRSMFVKAQWGKGVPVSLQCASGEWVHLPGVGSSAQGIVNTLRAWLKA